MQVLTVLQGKYFDENGETVCLRLEDHSRTLLKFIDNGRGPVN